MADVLQTLSVYYDENFVNYQEAGTIKKRNDKSNEKVYIELKSSKRRYLVRANKLNNNKYIMVNGDKVQLTSIKGQFKYTK
jgi:hypothetical protein